MLRSCTCLLARIPHISRPFTVNVGRPLTFPSPAYLRNYCCVPLAPMSLASTQPTSTTRPHEDIMSEVRGGARNGNQLEALLSSSRLQSVSPSGSAEQGSASWNVADDKDRDALEGDAGETAVAHEQVGGRLDERSAWSGGREPYGHSKRAWGACLCADIVVWWLFFIGPCCRAWPPIGGTHGSCFVYCAAQKWICARGWGRQRHHL